MANVKNFSLIGVGSDLQFGKAGTRLVNNSGTFNFKAANGSTDAALTTAGITSSAGNVTLTTGDVVLTSSSGVLSIGGTNIVELSSGGYPKISGSASVLIPTGNTAGRPGSGVAGMIRVNNDTPSASTVEYFDGTTWLTVATGGSTGALQTEIDNIETSLGAAIDTDGTFVAAGFTNNVALTDPSSFTDAIQQVADFAAGHDTLDEVFPATAGGNVIYSTGGSVWAQAAPGATSGVQGYDAGLAALASKTSTGILVQTGNDTYASTSLTAPARGFTITNADGVAGSPTFVLANTLAALENLGENAVPGYIAITGDGTAAVRTFGVVSGDLVITGDADGETTNTTFGLATVTQANTGNFVKVTLDTKGRVTGNTAVVASDIETLVDGSYLRLDGTNSMSASLDAGGFEVINLADPTTAQSAATKNYVDNAVTGLTWKTAVLNATTANVTLSGEQTIDGVLTSASRILVKNQTDPTENGIYVTAAGAWARSSDADTGADLDSAAVFVQQGTLNADSGWVQTTSNVTLGVSNIVWSQFSGAGAYTGGVGIDITGNVISAKLGAGITNLPSGEIGVDVESGKAIQLTTLLTGGQLTLVLDTGSGLSQSGTGLTIAAGGVTNAMLTNSAISLDADTGTGTVSLGGTLQITGDATQGIDTSVSTDTFNVTARDATDLQKGVASFDSTSFTVTSGDVTLNTVGVPYGGTGLTSVTLGEILYGNGTSALDHSSAFTFDDVDTLTVGTTTIQGSATDTVITATAINGDLVLMPNGTGSVVVGPVGAGLIQSDAGTALTVRGNDGLTLETGTTDIIMLMPTGTGTKVTVSGPTAADYATGLAASDLTNKQYVDDAIASGASAGAIKAASATVALNANGTTSFTTVIPANATVLSVKVQVTAVDTGATLSIGDGTSAARYMTTAENDPQVTGIYMAETYDSNVAAVTLVATVASSSGSGSGSCRVIVEYQVAE